LLQLAQIEGLGAAAEVAAAVGALFSAEERAEQVFLLEKHKADALVAKIAVLAPANPNNITLQTFDKTCYDSLSAEQKPRFLKCLNSGIENPASAMGCYACQPSDYDEFKPFFSKALAKYHGVAEDAKHVNNWSLEARPDRREDERPDPARRLGLQVRRGHRGLRLVG